MNFLKLLEGLMKMIYQYDLDLDSTLNPFRGIRRRSRRRERRRRRRRERRERRRRRGIKKQIGYFLNR